MKKTRIITFSALMAALSVVFLLLGSLVDMLDLTAVVLASFLVLIAREEMGYKSLGVYFVTGTISAILLPNKLVACEYFILAIYPVIKQIFDRQKKPVKLVLRYTYGVLSIAGIVLLTKLVFVPDTPTYMVALLSVGGLLIFLLYDVAIFRFVMYYRFKLRHKLRMDKFFY